MLVSPVFRRALIVLAAMLLLAALVVSAGCIRVSGGVWFFKEAELPEDWPILTPVGEIQLKRYPAYRQAIVTNERVRASQNRMFNTLFDHIKRNEIAMTAPVEMIYRSDAAESTADAAAGQEAAASRGAVHTDEAADPRPRGEADGLADRTPRMRAMAFLYDTPQRGPVGRQGDVLVRDVPPARVLSLGVRGPYTDELFKDAVDRLRDRLRSLEDLREAGPPRFLGYNSPFVPPFLRYGEVQIPVAAVGRSSASPDPSSR